jgi:hypothetical protein
MGVAGKILQYISRPAERGFCVDHPLDVFQWAQEGAKSGAFSKRSQLPLKLEFPVGKGIP